MRLYVGNLSYGTTDDSMRAAFEEFGAVDTAAVIMDRDTGRSKGFGFVEMANDAEATAAMEALNEGELDGRTIKVNEARPREQRPGFGGPRY